MPNRFLQFVIIFFLCWSDLLYAQKIIKKTDLEMEQLNGKVQLMIFIKYETDLKNETKWVFTDSNYYNNAGNLLLELDYNEDSTLNYRQVYEYDSSGQYLVHFRSFDYPYVLVDETFSEYDSNDNEIKFIQKYYDEEDTSISIYHYKYNSLNRLVEVKESNISEGEQSKEFTSTINSYTNNNKHRSSQSLDEEGNITYSIVEEYDASGRILKSTNLKTKYGTYYKYDSKGNKSSVKILDDSGQVNYTTLFSYDFHYNLIKQQEFDSRGKCIRNFAYKYELFDKKNNWLKMYFLIDGKVVGYALRKLSYYEK